jgi:hypothetical protein
VVQEPSCSGSGEKASGHADGPQTHEDDNASGEDHAAPGEDHTADRGTRRKEALRRFPFVVRKQGRHVTYAPDSILAVRHEFQRHTNLDNNALGIVRAERDTSYHVGKSWLKPGSYSVDESPRDRRPTEASSAIDIGYFEVVGSDGKTYTLYDYNRWLVHECASGAADTLDIREVIYTLDGETVKRWDRLKKRTGGDSSHRWHTHKSWFRDSESRNHVAVTQRWFRDVVFKGADMEWTDKPWRSADPISVADAIQQASNANEALREVRALRTEVAGLEAKVDEIKALLTAAAKR